MKISPINNNINNMNFKAKLSSIVKCDIADSKWFLEQEYGKDSRICKSYQKDLDEIEKLCPEHTIYKKASINEYGSVYYDFVVRKMFGDRKLVKIGAIDNEELYSRESISQLKKFIKSLDEEEKYNAEVQRRMNYKRKKFFKRLFGIN